MSAGDSNDDDEFLWLALEEYEKEREPLVFGSSEAEEGSESDDPTSEEEYDDDDDGDLRLPLCRKCHLRGVSAGMEHGNQCIDCYSRWLGSTPGGIGTKSLGEVIGNHPRFVSMTREEVEEALNNGKEVESTQLDLYHRICAFEYLIRWRTRPNNKDLTRDNRYIVYSDDSEDEESHRYSSDGDLSDFVVGDDEVEYESNSSSSSSSSSKNDEDDNSDIVVISSEE